ncbi:major royal jelly protein 9-like [Halictus rubicundus]|uniref:major royal jelly protein 9-like n=1 Tax=Halictus rubicundus TaxID=77578 RepID=UPI0040372EC5
MLTYICIHLLFLLGCIVRCSSSYTGIAKGTRNIFRNMFVSWLLAACFGAVCLQSQLAASLVVRNHDLEPIYEWKYVNYLYENKKQAEGYIKENNAPLDVDVSSDGRTFVTVIRDKGVPSSLNTVSDQHGDGGPLLKPYPNWDAAKTDCSGIFSVYRVAICQNVLYVIDNGQISGKQICPPRLYMFDLHTDKILKNLTIPTDVATNTTTNIGELITPIVDCCGEGEKNVYIADDRGYAIIVYRHDTGKFHRITGGPLNYDKKAVTYTINGESFQLEDGPVGMAWSCSKSVLYLSPMSSYNLVFIGKDALDNSEGDAPMRNFPDILPTQASAKAMSYSGTLFFGLVNSTSIACWNEDRPLTDKNIVIVAQNSEVLQFTSGLKVIEDVSLFGLNECLYAMTNRYQKLAAGTLNVTEVNFRILKGSVSNLTYGTRCASPGW